MGIGKLFYNIVYKPTAGIRYNLNHFGLAGWINMKRGEKAMKVAATQLQPIALLPNFVLECSFLTGKNYWHQTVFCAYSLAKVTGGKVKINIYSDGSLSEDHIATFNRVLPRITLINQADINRQLEEKLPIGQFPTLRHLREANPFFRKLVDMRLNNRYIIQLDSDMLFFKQPDELIKAYNTNNYFYMQDALAASYYVLPEAIIEKQFNISIKQKINSGILAYQSAAIDWDFVEQLCTFISANTLNRHPPMFEQTLNAIIISTLNGQALNPAYHILYSTDKPTSAADVIRHYIFKAKLPYFTTEWKKIIR